MQMLMAGGMGIVADEIRKADEDNPRGYLEWERVKKLKEDKSWLNECSGKAVKIISMLLVDLPSNGVYFLKNSTIWGRASLLFFA
jgi:hypothetical protein